MNGSILWAKFIFLEIPNIFVLQVQLIPIQHTIRPSCFQRKTLLFWVTRLLSRFGFSFMEILKKAGFLPVFSFQSPAFSPFLLSQMFFSHFFTSMSHFFVLSEISCFLRYLGWTVCQAFNLRISFAYQVLAIEPETHSRISQSQGTRWQPDKTSTIQVLLPLSKTIESIQR